MISSRNLNYDLMRLLGLLVIMIAHSSPPGWLFQLRNFGTPLLVIGSALTYSLIFKGRSIDVGVFYSKRLTRLVLPVWVFVTFFFLLVYVASIYIGVGYPFSLYEIVGTYTLVEGIGFVWVFKIYIALALLTPFVIYFDRLVKSNLFYFSVLVAAYVLYEVLVSQLTPLLSGSAALVFDKVVFILIPYAILYFYGFRLAQLKAGHVALISFASLILFCFMLVSKFVEFGFFVSTQSYKYPPTIYYLSYAFFAVNIIYLIVSRFSISGGVGRLIVWLSANSLWVYLWHIMAFYVWSYFFPDPDGAFVAFLFKMIFLLGFGVVCAVVQNKVVANIFTNNVYWKVKLAPLLSGNA